MVLEIRSFLHFVLNLREIRHNFLKFIRIDLHFRQGRLISGAMLYAIEVINNCSCSFQLDFTYVDIEADEQKSTEAIVDLICK